MADRTKDPYGFARKEETMGQPHDPNGGRFHLPEPGLYLVLICDPYEEPSYDDICYVCDGDHLDGFVARLHDAASRRRTSTSCAARSTNASTGTGWIAGTHRAP